MIHPLENSAAALSDLLKNISLFRAAMDEASDRVARALLNGHKLLVCGNGGSACDGSHLAGEFVGRFLGDRRPYPALCLSAEGGTLTCIGNDYDFQEIYARQVRAFAVPGDLLIVFSSSGNSQNLVEALREAEALGVERIAFLGRDGGRCAGLANTEFIVPSESTARIQEVHKLLLHVLCEIVDPVIAKASF